MSKNKHTNILFWAAILGALAVAIGAFGAHGLKPRLSDYQQAIFEKGVQYQFYHALACCLAGVLAFQLDSTKYFKPAAWCFGIGICFFSGSLYLLACRDLLPFSVAWAGPVTPLGGLLFVAGWALLALGVKKNDLL